MGASEPTAFEPNRPPLESMTCEDRLEGLGIGDAHHS